MSARLAPHGTGRRYRQRCRCLKCRAASADERRRQRDAIRAGAGPAHVPAELARERILELIAGGLRPREIAIAAKLSDRTVYEILDDGHPLVHRDTLAALRMIDPLSPGDLPSVSMHRVRVLLEELDRAGIRKTDVARALGYQKGSKYPRLPWTANRQRHVRRHTWTRLVTLYRLAAARGLVSVDALEEVGAL